MLYNFPSKVLRGLLIAAFLLAPTPAFAVGTFITVNTLADTIASDGRCSLREALTNAEADASTYSNCPAGSGDDTIVFTVSGTIPLGSALPIISDADGLTIDGGDAITISGEDLVRVLEVGSAATLYLSNITIANGFEGIEGGGILNDGTLTITHGVLAYNNAGFLGGAISNGGTLTIINSAVSGNSSGGVGGGIFNSGLGNLTITNSTMANNSTLDLGGAIYNFAVLTITNSTLSGNQTTNPEGLGAGIYADDATYLYNTIIADSLSGSDCTGVLAANVNNLIEDGSCSPAFSGDPKLGVPTGSPAYFPLNFDSPAVNAGDDDVCAAAPVSNESQNGVTRPVGTNCDIGSFEHPENPATTAITMDTPDASIPGATVSVSVNVSGGVGTPSGTVDISGADTNCTITLSGGAGSCDTVFDTAGAKTITATYNGDTDYASSADTESHTVQGLAATFQSQGTNDGWVLESGESTSKGGSGNASGSTISLGDNQYDRQYRGLLSFDTSSLPDTAVLLSVTLQIKKSGVSGTDPFSTHGNLLVDLRTGPFSGNNALQIGDFQASASKPALMSFSLPDIFNWASAIMSNADFSSINLSGLTQFRLRFSLDDNDDHGTDLLKIFSGNASNLADRPVLIVEYYLP